MQREPYASPTPGETRTQPEETAVAYRPRFDVAQVIETLSTGSRQVAGFISDQARTRPLILGSLATAILGAFVGIRIAQMQAMRRRKNAFQRAAEALGNLTPLIAALQISRRRKGPIEALRERGESMVDLTESMVGGIPGVAIPRRQAGGPQQVARQVGYAASLIPVALTLLRNPMVRDIGFRLLSRRIRGR
ncbi:MAG: hypothetical protein ACM3US_02585 [Sphingomonadaceae bacterium]